MRTEPALSVVLATPDSYDTVRLTMQFLRAQTVRDQVEVVLVGPTEEGLRAPAADLEGFWGHQLVAVGPVSSIARVNATGVRRARASLVALAEDHAFPEPEWAATFIAVHVGPWAVVGPSIRNANPTTVVSWCDFVVGYGPWMDPAAAGPAPFLPGHNSCYKKSVLLEYGDRLDEMMEAETVLQFDLCRRGHQLRVAPGARLAHTNFAFASSWLPVMFYQGRVFGSSRARSWGFTKRLFYGAASPLIPAVRLLRAVPQFARAGGPKPTMIRLLPMLALGLVFDGLGQMLGYLAGSGDAVARVAQYEFHRVRHIPDTDRQALQAQAPR
jgi:hypothetical protein